MTRRNEERTKEGNTYLVSFRPGIKIGKNGHNDEQKCIVRLMGLDIGLY